MGRVVVDRRTNCHKSNATTQCLLEMLWPLSSDWDRAFVQEDTWSWDVKCELPFDGQLDGTSTSGQFWIDRMWPANEAVVLVPNDLKPVVKRRGDGHGAVKRRRHF